MHLFPYASITKETGKSFEQIRKKVEKICVLPTKKLDIEAFVSYRVLEYNISSNDFMILMGRYGLSYGIANFAPVLRGRFSPAESGKNRIRFTIRPKTSGMITLALLFGIAIFGLIVSVKRNQWEGIITTAVFIAAAYWAILSKFNKEMKNYNDVIGQLTDQ